MNRITEPPMIEPGTTLCDLAIPNSLDTMVDRLSAPDHAGSSVALWVFEGRDRRNAARDRLAALGVDAQIRCAYKPLVHAALEEIDFAGAAAVDVRYPVIAGVPENRFLLEAYPFADLAGTDRVRFAPRSPADGRQLIAYEIDLDAGDGTCRTLTVPAPNRFTDDPLGDRVFNPCGWLQVRSPGAPGLDCDEPFGTDQEQAFRTAMDEIAAIARNGGEPFFDRLEIHIEAPFFERPLPVGHECLSTAEAMHEDLYFSALDVFRAARGLGPEDRTLRPGQVVPVLKQTDGPLRVVLATGRDPALQDDLASRTLPLADPAEATRWLEPSAVKAHLDALGGEIFEARSLRGRPVWSSHVDGPAPGLVITAGQHANEISGPVGALRAAGQLAAEGRTGFSVSPLVNPDGYALFRELCRNFPNQLNHAARFTAAGCDLAHVERGHENEAHHVGRERTGAKLHMNLHGYPAHEWTRPFSGYTPRGAEIWCIPRGFLLILRHWPGWEMQGRAILDAVIDALAADAQLAEFNRLQRERSMLYAGGFPFEHRGEIPFVIEEGPKEMFPVTIITEAPDQTVEGELFKLFHTAQMKAVLAAAQAAGTVLAEPS
jgi:hypothetical protein